MILFILAGSAGLRVFKHACEEDGVFTSYIVQLDDHCEENIQNLPECCRQEQIDKDDCCSDEVDIYQVDFEYFQDCFLEMPFFLDKANSPVWKWKLDLTDGIKATDELKRPPPLTLRGRDVLIHQQIFRI